MVLYVCVFTHACLCVCVCVRVGVCVCRVVYVEQCFISNLLYLLLFIFAVFLFEATI